MRTNRLKRERTASLSPPLRPSGSGGSPPPTPTTFVGLIQYRSGNSSNVVDAATRRLFVMQHNFLHMQALQEVLRRTSLAEMRDREVVEWLLGAERWLRDFHQPLQDPDSTAAERDGSAGGAAGGPSASTAVSGGVSAPFFPASSVAPADGFTRAYSTALSELRLLVIGVLHTMPWWRVVETVAKDPSEKNFARTGADGGSGGQSSSGGGGSGAAAMAARRSRTAGGAAAAMSTASTRQISGANGTAAADRALAARQALTRWHVRLQIAFERVCLVLIEASQHTVRGVMEVLLKPCQLRPPVRDGARRSIPSDSFIRVLNAVATLYSTHYVMEVLESCITDFMPRQRWAERRHHVACTAVLLYVALEGHTPAFHPRLGNSQSLQRAVELLKSLRSRGGGGAGSGGDDDGSPWRLPRATRSSSLTVGTATSEDSGTDVGGGGGSSSATSGRHQHHHHHHPSSSRGLSAMLPGSSGTGVLPAGYVSATLLEDARVGGRRLRQPALLRPDGATAHSSLMTTTTASDTEASDGGTGGKGFVAVGADVLSESGGGGGGAAAQPAGFSAGLPHLSDVAVEHNNKLLAYRNSIVRLLLNRLLDVEQTLEPREGDEAADRASQMRGGREMSGTYASGGWGPSHGSFTGGRSPSGSAPPSASASPSSLFPASVAATTSALSHPSSLSGQSMLFPSAPAFAGAVNGTVTASSSALSSPAALSPAGIPAAPTGLLLLQHRPATVSLHAPFGAGVARPLEECFSRLSLPYLRILRDCTTLVYGRLADDLRRQQVAGSCGNADWWNEILYFYLTVAMRVERPVYLLYLAPSLAMLGTDDESVNVLHKLITLVTKGSMPMEQPRTMTATGGGSNAAVNRGTSLQPVQPVRLRMAPPTGGSRRVVTMEERLRAARHIFPLFRFLRSRLDDAGGEGLRRRLLKWTAQELRRLGGVGLTLSANNTSCSSSGVAMRSRAQPSREMRLALVTFAQCAAMSELMGVDILPSPQTDGAAVGCTGKGGNGSGASFTATSASGDASDSIAAALQPLLARYTLQTEQPEEEMNDDARSDDGGGGRGSSAESSDSSTSSTPPRRSGRTRGRRGKKKEAVGPATRRQLDLRQMEFEGLLQPLLMSYCPWQAWLR